MPRTSNVKPRHSVKGPHGGTYQSTKKGSKRGVEHRVSKKALKEKQLLAVRKRYLESKKTKLQDRQARAQQRFEQQLNPNPHQVQNEPGIETMLGEQRHLRGLMLSGPPVEPTGFPRTHTTPQPITNEGVNAPQETSPRVIATPEQPPRQGEAMSGFVMVLQDSSDDEETSGDSRSEKEKPVTQITPPGSQFKTSASSDELGSEEPQISSATSGEDETKSSPRPLNEKEEKPKQEQPQQRTQWFGGKFNPLNWFGKS